MADSSALSKTQEAEQELLKARLLRNSSDYHRVRYVSSGAHSYVYEGVHIANNTKVAIKVFKQTSIDRIDLFLNEVKTLTAAQGFRCTNIVELLGGYVQPEPTLIFPYFEHGSLHKFLATHWTAVGVAEKVEIALDIAQSMQSLHEHGIFHCVLSSGNVLIRQNADLKRWQAIVTDFGHCYDSRNSELPLGRGHPRWRDPSLPPKTKPTEATEVYMFGGVLYELFTGTKPFRTISSEDLVKKAIEPTARGSASDLPTYTPQTIKNLVDACWGDVQSRPKFADINMGLRLVKLSEPEEVHNISGNSSCKKRAREPDEVDAQSKRQKLDFSASQVHNPVVVCGSDSSSECSDIDSDSNPEGPVIRSEPQHNMHQGYEVALLLNNTT